MNVKSHYTAKELANMNLSSLPSTHCNVRVRAEKENWTSRKRVGKGGGIEYAFKSLPADVRAEIAQKQALEIAKAAAPARESRRELAAMALAQRDFGKITNKQREIADARLVVVNYINGIAQTMSKTAAIEVFSRLSREGNLPTEIAQCLDKALAKHRKRGVGTRTLAGWVADAARYETAGERLAAFAPQTMGRPRLAVSEREWFGDFLACYQQANGKPVAEAYREFCLRWSAKYPEADIPSLSTVRQALKQLPKFVLERGRLSGARMNALKTYRRRDWSGLKPNDVWVGDGHSLKMKVAHPEHGQPFTPELTLIMDAASRYIVGWSLAYSENTFAVADALRHGMIHNGIPAIYYSDNGAGQKNHVLDADITGIFTRFGIHHETGIPGNPQGRGIIERVMKTLAHPIARQFATYYGPNADPDTVRKISTATASLAKAQSEGRTQLTVKQGWARGKLPSWQQLLDVIEAAVRAYNYEHIHRELGVSPAAMRQHLFKQMSAQEYFPLSEVEAREMFRPAFRRVVERAWIRLFNRHYWHRELEALDGVEVVVLVDQHDAGQVLVRHLDGRYICEAELNGNADAAFAPSLVEDKRKERTERKLKRLAAEAAKAEAELRPVIEAQAQAHLSEWVITPPPEKVEADKSDFWQDIAKQG